ncbi:MAG: Flp pilus assembly complex ATPase component TadA [Planctomycetes bacterium]|nr:Flp pilus assembly complex ATPase component TadA [Planctomycetota bacterium]
MPGDPRPLGEILIESSAITQSQLTEGLAYQRGRNLKIGEALVALSHTDEHAVARALAKQAGLPYVDLRKGAPPKQLIERVPSAIAKDAMAIPVAERDGAVIVAIDDPARAPLATDSLRFVLNQEVRCAMAAKSVLRRAIEANYGALETPREATAAATQRHGATLAGDQGEDAPIVRLVQHIIEDAINVRASDIHIEPFGNRLRIRFRIDGVLKETASHPAHLHGPLLARLKVMASMDIAEKRKPQDGRIGAKAAGRDIDIRASVLPGSHGETMVLRLLDREKGLLSLHELGLEGKDAEAFQRILKLPNGIVLVTGPTGSGKTTTLYAALRELNRPDVKIITAEDPVEYHISGINQCQVKSKVGLDFARILRAMLRQAPNVILVGEIRDKETAEIAIQAALTGHLVFSTLHTNDAVSALTRLTDIGVKPFLVAASVRAILAQRLIRILCKDCREACEAQDTDARMLGIPVHALAGKTMQRARGCVKCNFQGYRGRRALYELCEIDEEMREMIFRNEPVTAIRDYAKNSMGMTTILGDGVRKIIAGETSVQEVLRVSSSIVEVEEKLDAEIGELIQTADEEEAK